MAQTMLLLRAVFMGKQLTVSVLYSLLKGAGRSVLPTPDVQADVRPITSGYKS